ncbi:MAG: hypothetical protein CVV42_00160 [Candidatus Riflebacteria bacterium HGW-Riflebacteria-2]|jgi:preprotein translocase subunit SecE|nr:MAG: hypothetical protein CVV42_00160 [Candidatus Riflebacteria bacterium HGW-Riflebacteria-2]
MEELRCSQCSAKISIPDGYNLPFLKCENCGAHQKTPQASNEPTYSLLDPAARARSQQPVDLSSLPPLPPSEPLPKKQKWRSITEPIIASAARKEAAAKLGPKPMKATASVLSERAFIEDALGSHGMEMLMQLAASYMAELNEKTRAKAKSKAMQALMRTRVTAELASQALAYAEKSDEIDSILWDNYRSNMIRGLVIFAVGLVISALVYALAHPGWEFILFQVPFAVGLAYAVNAGINMAGIKIPALRNEMIHYGFIIVATLMILAYIAAGIWL